MEHAHLAGERHDGERHYTDHSPGEDDWDDEEAHAVTFAMRMVRRGGGGPSAHRALAAR